MLNEVVNLKTRDIILKHRQKIPCKSKEKETIMALLAHLKKKICMTVLITLVLIIVQNIKFHKMSFPKNSKFISCCRMGGPPTPTDHDYNCTLPKTINEFLTMLDYMDALTYENDTSLPRSNYLPDVPDWNTCLFSNDELSL